MKIKNLMITLAMVFFAFAASAQLTIIATNEGAGENFTESFDGKVVYFMYTDFDMEGTEYPILSETIYNLEEGGTMSKDYLIMDYDYSMEEELFLFNLYDLEWETTVDLSLNFDLTYASKEYDDGSIIIFVGDLELEAED